MKVKSEDILKPGAVLVTEKIDFNDPEIKRLFADTKKRINQIRRQQRWTQEDYDSLKRVITI